ncbi:hypothetical protein F5Y02DRAFT_391054 [Annulohypoxylon stygium]|nr:hypothetical protein F5Y02DRAFT_391054 [Annulohypoxylon stygium]
MRQVACMFCIFRPAYTDMPQHLDRYISSFHTFVRPISLQTNHQMIAARLLILRSPCPCEGESLAWSTYLQMTSSP